MSVEFTVVPEYSFVEDLHFSTLQTEFDSGVVQTRANWERPKRKFNLSWSNAILSEKEQIVGFFREQVGPAGEFLYQPPDPVASPFSAGTPGSQTQITGSYGSRTYWFAISFVTAYGETLISQVSSFALSSSNLFTLSLPRFPTNVTKGRIYVSATSSTTLKLQAEVVVSSGIWIEPDFTIVANGLLDNGNPPTGSTAHEKVNVHLLEDVLSIDKRTANVYSIKLIFEEIP